MGTVHSSIGSVESRPFRIASDEHCQFAPSLSSGVGALDLIRAAIKYWWDRDSVRTQSNRSATRPSCSNYSLRLGRTHANFGCTVHSKIGDCSQRARSTLAKRDTVLAAFSVPIQKWPDSHSPTFHHKTFKDRLHGSNPTTQYRIRIRWMPRC